MMVHPLWCQMCERLRDFEVGEYDRVTAHCEAYPEGIPQAVVYSGHLYPKPDDNGLQFKSIGKMQDYLQQTRKEEDASYQELAEYYEYLDMSEQEFREKMKLLHGKEAWRYEKPTWEDQPHIW